jgi:hypothetical protein
MFPIEQFQKLLQGTSGVIIANQKFSIEVDLGSRKRLSMIRIWNYCKSRTNCDRGASRIHCKLDDQNVLPLRYRQLFLIDLKKATAN